jgi:hypothetical protein
MDYKEKYIKYKLLYLNLKSKYNYHQYGGLNNYMIPRYAFTNNRDNMDIYKWDDKNKSLNIIDDNYIFLSSSICPDNFLSNFNIDNCNNATFKLYNLINKIPSDSNHYIICINYYDIDTDLKDFQIGITETTNLYENEYECVRRGIIEEIGLCFYIEELMIGKQDYTYNDNIICFINKLSDLKLKNINDKSDIKLKGNLVHKNINKNKKQKIKQKINIFLYDTLDNIIIYLSQRYINGLTKYHYNINNKFTITTNILEKVNNEKKNLEIYVISVIDIKNMLLKINKKEFN